MPGGKRYLATSQWYERNRDPLKNGFIPQLMFHHRPVYSSSGSNGMFLRVIMFDKHRLQDAHAKYKLNFVSTLWGNGKYKWEAIKLLQDD